MYVFLKFCMRIAVRLYFRKITCINLDTLPTDKPIIFTPNHPSAFMDPILIGALVKRNTHFIARGESFRKQWARFLLRKMRMIPIYRPDKTKHLLHKNKSSFEACYEVLEKNGQIVIFPEGLSRTENKLRKIHTGAARMALGAENKNDFTLDVHIIPVGISYCNPHKFRSTVTLVFGQPIRTREYIESYTTDQSKTVRELTDRIEDRIIHYAGAIKDERRARLADDLIRIFVDPRGPYTDLSTDRIPMIRFLLLQVRQLEQKRLEHAENLVRSYHDHQKEKANSLLRLNFKAFAKLNLPNQLTLILGYFLNYIPYRLTGWLTDSIIARTDFRGSFLLTLGFWVFLFYYVFLGISAQLLFGSTVITLILPVTATWSGILSLHPLDLFRLNKRKLIRSLEFRLNPERENLRRKLLEVMEDENLAA